MKSYTITIEAEKLGGNHFNIKNILYVNNTIIFEEKWADTEAALKQRKLWEDKEIQYCILPVFLFKNSSLFNLLYATLTSETFYFRLKNHL